MYLDFDETIRVFGAGKFMARQNSLYRVVYPLWIDFDPLDYSRPIEGLVFSRVIRYDRLGDHVVYCGSRGII
jgi:hypothetical protein